MDQDPIVTTSAARQIAERLRTAIVNGHLAVDERLPTEDELAARFGVSRPTVREALKRLAAQNLIRSRRGPTGGTFVNRPSPEDLADALCGSATLLVGLGAFGMDEIATARFEMEAACCRLAAVNRTEDDLARLTAELDLQSNADLDDAAFCASDVRFHRTVVDAAGNRVLSLAMVLVIEALVPVMNMVLHRVRVRRAVVDLHARMLDGLRAGDPDATVDGLRDLTDYLRDRYAEALADRKRGTTGPPPLVAE